MRRFDFHIGDYTTGTTHLSLLEHGAYLRLLCLYYADDGQALPVDHGRIYRLACARTRAERLAIDSVLAEYFYVDDEQAGAAPMYRHARCDREIAAARQRMSDAEKRETNERERMARHRAERARLFAELRDRGQSPAWNVSMTVLRKMASDAGISPKGDDLQRDLQRSCNEHATANHSPSTIHHPPHTQVTGEGGADLSAAGVSCVSGDGQGVGVNAPAPRPAQAVGLDGQGQAKIGDMVKALKNAGIADARSSNADLRRALDAGVTQADLVDAAALARAKGKGIAYVLGIVNNRRQQAQSAPSAAPARQADAPVQGVPSADATQAYLAEQAAHRRRAAGESTQPVDVRKIIAAKSAGLVAQAGQRAIVTAV